MHHKPMSGSDGCSEAADAGLIAGRATSAGSCKTALPTDGNKAGQQEQAGAFLLESTATTAGSRVAAMPTGGNCMDHDKQASAVD